MENKFNLHDKVMTPDGEIKIQIIMHDPKTHKTKYARMGARQKWYNEEDLKLIKGGKKC